MNIWRSSLPRNQSSSPSSLSLLTLPSFLSLSLWPELYIHFRPSSRPGLWSSSLFTPQSQSQFMFIYLFIYTLPSSLTHSLKKTKNIHSFVQVRAPPLLARSILFAPLPLFYSPFSLLFSSFLFSLIPSHPSSLYLSFFHLYIYTYDSDAYVEQWDEETIWSGGIVDSQLVVQVAGPSSSSSSSSSQKKKRIVVAVMALIPSDPLSLFLLTPPLPFHPFPPFS
ncbi:hypothetical protein PGT21_011712 [Puccinia graminis f. sp. tritici]|uniref:Transmembrane protein n=1 Tax=Puccinia graminis f. sp. tritici TaxID=56615 RepID=A0A5B0NN23_PUCGR|nr:hypothetical protein PGT21_011712 [Puccinia graminis f. sp. tritici]